MRTAAAAITDPRQGIETCASVEFLLSCEMLLKIAGDLTWADRCEDVAFNTFPPALTADLKALHYIVSPNVCQLDSGNKAPGIQNKGDMLSYDPHSYRCCQHNVAHGWPYFAEHLWMATPDNGLAAVFYAASEVTAKVGEGQQVTLKSTTLYPFEDTVKFTVNTDKLVQFPLYLRVPGWCEKPALRINGKKTVVYAEPRTFLVIDRKWRPGDTVELTLPMALAAALLDSQRQHGLGRSRAPDLRAQDRREVRPAWWNGCVARLRGLSDQRLELRPGDRRREAARWAIRGPPEELAQGRPAFQGRGRSYRDQNQGQEDRELEAGLSRPDRRGPAQPHPVHRIRRDRNSDPDGCGPASHLGLPVDR